MGVRGDVQHHLEVNVDPNLYNIDDALLEIFELKGRKVLQFELNKGIHRSVDVFSLSPGIYILKPYVEDKKVEWKFVKL